MEYKQKRLLEVYKKCKEFKDSGCSINEDWQLGLIKEMVDLHNEIVKPRQKLSSKPCKLSASLHNVRKYLIAASLIEKSEPLDFLL